jgi:hypothetical protein
VWTQRGKFKFYDTGWSEGGYIDKTQHSRRGTYVETVILDDIIALSKGRTIMKVDIEGAEVSVLMALEKLYKVTELAIEAHGREDLLIKILRLHGYDCKVTIYKLNPQLFKEWLKVRPKIYGFTIAIYRLLASSFFHPTITVVKATKRT